jgi:hypothetical protein
MGFAFVLTFRDGVMLEGRLLFLFYLFKDGVVFKIIIGFRMDYY